MFRYVVFILCLTLYACGQKSEPEEPPQAEAPKPGVQETAPPEPEPEQENTVDGDYIPFPDGFGYMEDLPQLKQATAQGDRSVIRQHAWGLWAGIMYLPAADKGDWPLWYSWPNTQMAFSDGAGPVGLATGRTHSPSIIQKNRNNISVNTKTPIYDIPEAVKTSYPNATKCKDGDGNPTICSGKHFLFNGDILIPTESLSKSAFEHIRSRKLYLKSTLDDIHNNPDQKNIPGLPARSIVTKHMYWPVKADRISGIPIWKNNFPPTFTGYAGYEEWDTFVAIDPSGERVGKTADISFLYGVKDHSEDPIPTRLASAKVYGLKSFYHHKITKDDWNSFDEADKAILNAASYWAYNRPFGVNDYLVTIAMHVNTKELDSWTLQSVWWSDTPNEGPYSEDRPRFSKARGPWYHYLLTDAYAVPPNPDGKWDIAVNPYIEGVIHPIATNCRNCHVRAGWPADKKKKKVHASYQSKDCPELLESLTPASECFEKLTLTDYLWIIPDRAQ